MSGCFLEIGKWARNRYRRLAPLEEGRDGVMEGHSAALILTRNWMREPGIEIRGCTDLKIEAQGHPVVGSLLSVTNGGKTRR